MSTIENPTEREKDINNLGRFITKFLRHELKSYIQKIILYVYVICQKEEKLKTQSDWLS